MDSSTGDENNGFLNSGVFSKNVVPPIETNISGNLVHGFESMTFELREIFDNYIKKIERKISNELEKIEYERSCIEQEKKRLYREIEYMKKSEYERIQKLEKNLEEEIIISRKLLIKEKQENSRQLIEEKELFDKKQQELANYWRMLEKQIQEEKLEIEKIRDKITEINFASKSTVELNVGGTIFEVSRNLLIEGKAKGSILDRIYSGRTFEIEIETDRNGNIFFDRDPEIFKIILNYLRDNKKCLPSPSNVQLSIDILKEMSYYGIKFFDNSLIYVFGGSDGKKILDSAEVMITPSTLYEEKFLGNESNASWSRIKSMLSPRTHGSSSDLDKFNCALFGGYNDAYKALSTLEIYDPLTDTWREGPSMSIGRRNLSSVTLEDGRIFAIGGFDGKSIVKLTEFYDSRMKHWCTAPSLNIARSSASCVKLDQNSIAIFGGTSGEQRLRSVEIFDIRRNRWEILESSELLEVRSGSIAYCLHGNICIWGGIDQDNNILNSGELLNIASTPKNVSTYRKPLNKGILDSKICPILLNNYSAIMCGGQTNESTLRDTSFYNFKEDSWEKGPLLNLPRCGHSITRLDI